MGHEPGYQRHGAQLHGEYLPAGQGDGGLHTRQRTDDVRRCVSVLLLLLRGRQLSEGLRLHRQGGQDPAAQGVRPVHGRAGRQRAGRPDDGLRAKRPV